MAFGSAQVMAGRMDRRVKLLQQFTELNELNEPVQTYIHVLTCWAEVKYLTVTEIDTADALRAGTVAEFHIRFRKNIDDKYRIEHDGVIYRIIGITEEGRRETLKIMAQNVGGQANG